jgi:hypothetical protein
MPKVFIEDDQGNVRIVQMESDEISVGRADDNDIVLAERNVSRHHVRIRQEEGRFTVTPVAARYGMRVNGEVVAEPVAVGFGEPVRLGDFTLKVLPPDSDVDVPVAQREARPQTQPPKRLTRQDVDAMALEGWRSDFYDEDDRTSRRSAIVRLIVLFFLLIIAAGLGYYAYQAYVEEDSYWEQHDPVTMPAAPKPVEASPAVPAGSQE